MSKSSDYSFIAVADIHIGHKLYNIPELEEDINWVFSRIVEEAIQRKVSYLVIAGDLYDTNKPTPSMIRFVRQQVALLKSNGVTAVGIAGDHDKPLNGSSWMQLSDIVAVNTVPHFCGFDYSDNPVDVLNSVIAEADKRQGIQWVFLHGQVPTLFNFTEDKKRLDLDQVDFCDLFPDIQGIILGDIHSPVEGHLMCKDRKVYMGYCGSPAVINSSEIENKAGIFYSKNGKSLERIKIPQRRVYLKYQEEDELPIISMIEYFSKLEHKPVLIVEFENKEKLKLLSQLQNLAFVRTMKIRHASENKSVENVNIRSELSTHDRIFNTLKGVLTDTYPLEIGLKLLGDEDPKTVLDQVRVKYGITV